MSTSKDNLPALSDLHHAPEIAFKNDKLNRLLSQPVHAKWVKQHPMVKTKDKDGKAVPLQYLPIDKVKFLLTRIFQHWKSEITNVTPLFQSICVTVRLHYRNPITGDWLSQDGIGAVGVQTDAGASAADLGAIKFDAVMKAAPAAESYAIKNAAEKIGNIFGASLNRWEIPDFKGSYETNGGTKAAPKPSGYTAPATPDFDL